MAVGDSECHPEESTTEERENKRQQASETLNIKEIHIIITIINYYHE